MITGVEDGLLDDGTLVSFASLSHTVPGDQISLFRPMVDDTSFALMLRFSGASSSNFAFSGVHLRGEPVLEVFKGSGWMGEQFATGVVCWLLTLEGGTRE